MNEDGVIDRPFILSHSNRIADFFIKEANNNMYNGEFTHLKVQKLLYYSYVWMFVLEKTSI